MEEAPTRQHRPRRTAAICTAAIAAALFTPVPATAEVIIERSHAETTADTTKVEPLAPTHRVGLSLISIGLIGIGLSMCGLVIVAYRRRQW